MVLASDREGAVVTGRWMLWQDGGMWHFGPKGRAEGYSAPRDRRDIAIIAWMCWTFYLLDR